MGFFSTITGGGVTDHGALTGLSDDDHSIYKTAAKGMTLVGSDLTERTTSLTGADAADLSSVTGLNITQGTPVEIRFSFRKTSGAVAAPRFGLKINGTVICSTNASGSRVIEMASTNEAQSGICVINLLPGNTNYQQQILITGYSSGATGSSPAGIRPAGLLTNTIPSAAITSITITGDAVNALVTIATDQMRVYTLPTS